MSEARVYVNGKEVIFWPYGYSSFHIDVTEHLTADGKNNVLAVRLENRPSSSRWYPGAGLYRNVHVLSTGNTCVPVWGTQITTPHVKEGFASVSLKTKVQNPGDEVLEFQTVIYGPDGKEVSSNTRRVKYQTGRPVEQTFIVEDPQLWSPESPSLYVARTTLKRGEEVLFYLCFVVSRWGKTEFLCYICRIYKRGNQPNRIISNVEKIICSSSAGRVLRGIRSEKRNPA